MINLKDVRQILEMTGGENILRRYFVMNGFDGALTALGIVLSAFFVGAEAKTIILIGTGASAALGVSGFWIAFLTERAERTRDIKELETHLITDLSNTRLSRSNTLAALILSTANLSPMFFSFFAIIPYMFVSPILFSLQIAHIISFLIIAIEIIVLGALLGAISKENKILYIIKIIPAAAAIALFNLVIDYLTY